MKFTLTIFLCAAVFSTVFSYAHAHDIGKETTMKQEQLNDKDIIVKRGECYWRIRCIRRSNINA